MVIFVISVLYNVVPLTIMIVVLTVTTIIVTVTLTVQYPINQHNLVNIQTLSLFILSP